MRIILLINSIQDIDRRKTTLCYNTIAEHAGVIGGVTCIYGHIKPTHTWKVEASHTDVRCFVGTPVCVLHTVCLNDNW